MTLRTSVVEIAIDLSPDEKHELLRAMAVCDVAVQITEKQRLLRRDPAPLCRTEHAAGQRASRQPVRAGSAAAVQSAPGTVVGIEGRMRSPRGYPRASRTA